MFYKNCTFFLLPETPSAERLNTALQAHSFTAPNSLDRFSEGFDKPQPFTQELVFTAGKTAGISLRRDEKVLPADIVRTALNEQVQYIQNTENRRVGRRERQGLKNKIIDELLPKALTGSRRTDAVIAHNMLLTNSSSHNKAEQLLGQLRTALGGLEAKQPVTRQPPSGLMTNWLRQGQAAGNFTLGSDAKMRGGGGSAPVIKISNKDLTEQQIIQHTQNGMTVVELRLIWREQIAFVLDEHFTLKRIRFLDTSQGKTEIQNDDADAQDFAAASQLIMAENISQIVKELSEHMGGWV